MKAGDLGRPEVNSKYRDLSIIKNDFKIINLLIDCQVLIKILSAK